MKMKMLKSLPKFREFPPNARKFIVVKTMESLSLEWMGPVYTVYMTSQGMELWQVSAANMIFMLLKALIDPPTGNLGDRYGHVKVYLWGIAVMVLSTFTYAFANTFWFVVLAESIGALGAALISEALEAWLYNHESQVTARKAKAYVQSVGRSLGIIPKLLNSTILITFGLSGPWFASSAWFALTLCIASVLVRNGMGKQIVKGMGSEATDVKPVTLKEGVKVFLRSWRLKSIFIGYFVTNLAFQPLNMFWGEYVRLSIGVNNLGWISALLTIAMSAGSHLAGQLSEEKINLKRISLMVLATSTLVLLSGLSHGAFVTILFFALHEFPRLLTQGTMSNFVNQKSLDNPISESNRATLGSILSAGGTLGAAFGLLYCGIASLFLTIQQVWIVSGVVLLILSIVIFLFSLKYERKPL